MIGYSEFNLKQFYTNKTAHWVIKYRTQNSNKWKYVTLN